MRILPRIGRGRILLLALALCLGLTMGQGCTKKHIYTEPVRADRPEQQASQAPAQGAAETVEVLTMGEDLAEEPLPQEPVAQEPDMPPAQPGLVETTYSNEPVAVAEAPAPQTVAEAPAPQAQPPAAVNPEDPMSPEAMAEEPMPFTPPDQTIADPAHAAPAEASAEAPAQAPAPAVQGTFDQTGLASWVADENKGLPTASGELYDPADLTAAHRTYPLNTRLKVTNLDNGRSVVVRINDRGPFKKERIVDLSKAAAQELGMVEQGTAEVGVSVVDEAPAVAPAVPAAGGTYVQVGAFGNRQAADELLDTLVRSGYAQSRVVKASNETVYRVQAGAFQTEDEARKALEYFRQEFPGSFIVTE